MKVALLKMASKRQGGLEKYAAQIAQAFAKRGDEVTFLTSGYPQNPLAGIEYCPFSLSSWPSFLKLEQFDRCVTRWLRKNPTDLVFGMERNRIQTHLRAGGGVHAAYLKSRIESEGWLKYGLCQINPLHRKILEIERAAYLSSTLRKIFVNSSMVKRDLLTHYGVDPAKIEVIHNGVEWEEHKKPFSLWEEARPSIFKNFGLDPNVFHILFIGNGYRRKGLDSLLRALSVWNYRDFHLSVVGKEKQLRRYMADVEKLKLKNRVTFFGPKPTMIPFYQMADVLAIPSYYDPFANVTLEALSFGLHVLSSKTNGGHEILSSENGSIIDSLNGPDALISALERSLRFRKTAKSAQQIRDSIAHLDFSIQLNRLIDACA